MTISEKVAYLKGLADGLDLQEKPSKEGKLIAKIIDILEDVGFAVEDLEVEVEALTDEVESVAEDLSDVETMVFEDWEDETTRRLRRRLLLLLSGRRRFL